jgi:hypothetical protein
MIQTSSVFPEKDKDAERRRALGKVYSLLLRLAEEAEKQTALSSIITGEEKIGEPFTEKDQINNEIKTNVDPEFINSDDKQAK